MSVGRHQILRGARKYRFMHPSSMIKQSVNEHAIWPTDDVARRSDWVRRYAQFLSPACKTKKYSHSKDRLTFLLIGTFISTKDNDRDAVEHVVPSQLADCQVKSHLIWRISMRKLQHQGDACPWKMEQLLLCARATCTARTKTEFLNEFRCTHAAPNHKMLNKNQT